MESQAGRARSSRSKYFCRLELTSMREAMAIIKLARRCHADEARRHRMHGLISRRRLSGVTMTPAGLMRK